MIKDYESSPARSSLTMDKPDCAATSQGGAAPLKFSRYRSVRKAASKTPPKAHSNYRAPVASSAPPPQLDFVAHPASTPAIKKSMSRYRRQRPPSNSNSTSAADGGVAQSVFPAYGEQSMGLRSRVRDNENGHDADASAEWRANAFESRRGMLDRMSAKINSSSEDEDARERHRQNAMDCLVGSKHAVPDLPYYRRPVHGKEQRVTGGQSSDETERPSTNRHNKYSQPKDKPDNEVAALSPVEPNPSTRFPGIDAPISAVNAGERQVRVRYKKNVLRLSVRPSTSVQDLLSTASESLAGQIDPTKFVLMESFEELGLERSLRRYESVREVMNSWAHDGQNTLLIVPASSLESLAVLEAQHVSHEAPAEVTLQMYYSQRPRKWDKRYVTLRSDGQITVSKKENSQEQLNACHLSDFDVYSPTANYLLDNLKPPKRLCQAVKSQQKSSMFLSTEHFVHFFSTNHKDIAERWYRAIQAWRSWYLVTKLGAAQKANDEEIAENKTFTSRPLINPFEDPSENDVPSSIDRTRSTKAKELYSRKKGTREHGPPPSSFPKSLALDTDLPSSQSNDESPFSATGLLGRTYTIRQRVMKEREEQEKRVNDEALTLGLVGSMASRQQSAATHPSRPNSRSNTMTSTHAPDLSALKRPPSTQKPKPLVDLTPVYQEPPQHAKKGRGVTVDPGMPLVDAATGPEAPGGIAIPPATTWKRPPNSVKPEPPLTSDPRTRKRSNTARSVSTQHRHHHHYHPSTAPGSPIGPGDSQEDPFAPNSLLARSTTVHANKTNTGHGVATGDRNASKPMLDVTPQNPFAEGSLLRQL